MNDQQEPSHAVFGLVVGALLCTLLSILICFPLRITYAAYVFNALLGGASLVLVIESLHRARGADRITAWLGGGFVLAYLLWELRDAVLSIFEFVASH